LEKETEYQSNISYDLYLQLQHSKVLVMMISTWYLKSKNSALPPSWRLKLTFLLNPGNLKCKHPSTFHQGKSRERLKSNGNSECV